MQGTIFESWFASEIAALYGSEANHAPGVVLGLPVWGDRFVDRFMRYCLPTLMTPENLAALQVMAARFVFYTDDVLSLWRRVAFLERAGLPVQIRPIPAEVLKAAAEGVSKYQLLGVVQNLAVQMAARTGKSNFSLYPDVLYSRGYFASLLRLSADHDAIVQNGATLDFDGARPDLETFRQADGGLALSDIELGDLCWKHLHAGWRTILAGAEGFRFFNLIAWRGRDGMQIASPLMAPVWLSPRLCREAPVLAPAPLDAEAPALASTNWYMPTVADGMTFVEFSDASKPVPSPCSFDHLLDLWWRQMNFSDTYLPVAARRFTIPMSPVDDAPTDAEIEEMHAGMMDALRNYKPRAMEKFLASQAVANRRLRRHRGMGG